jgi:hypothetical protein
MMNPSTNKDYNPADDDNQGVAQLLSQAQEANDGVPQAGGIDAIRAQGPEPVKEEVNDSDKAVPDTEANGINDDLLIEEDIADGDVAVDNN